MRISFSLLHFGWKSRTDRGLPKAPRPDHVHPLSPPDNGPRLNPPDRQTVLTQWRRLGSLDPKSRNHIELLKTLVDIEGHRNVALKFTDDDAGIVINAIGDVSPCCTIVGTSPTAYRPSADIQALRGGGLQDKLACHTFFMLRKLAGKTGQVPDSYLVGQDVDYQVEKTIFACGGFADVRRGRLAGKTVAVKTIRTALDSDLSKIRKVGIIAGVRSWFY